MQQVVKPDLTVRVPAGNCHQLVRTAFGASNREDSAWEAWERAEGKHTGALPKDVAVPVFFSHWGTYGIPPTYDNWGHVVIWVPGKGFLSSPGSGFGSKWFTTIHEIETYFRAKYVGWAETINGVRVVKETPDTITPFIEGEDMFVIKLKNGRWYLVVPNGAGKMRATWLPGKSGASETDLPIFDYAKATDEHMKQLRAAVDGI